MEQIVEYAPYVMAAIMVACAAVLIWFMKIK